MKIKRKKGFNKKAVKAIWLVYAICSMLFVLYLIDAMFSVGLDESTDRHTLNNNWDITINETYYENVSLDSLRFPAVAKGDRIVMRTMLPEDWKFEETALCLHIRQTTVEMYVDEEPVYKYGHERLEGNDTVGSGIQLINFSNQYKGKELKIVLDVTENHAFSKFDSMWLGEWSDAYRFVIMENRLPLFLGSFLLVFGIAVTFLLIFAVTLSIKYASILCLSIFSICIGLWTLCYHNVVVIFSIPLYTVSLIEYMTLLMAPLPIIGYMYNYVKQLKDKKMMMWYHILFSVQFLLTVVTILLHTKDIVHSAEMLMYHHVLYIVNTFFFSYVLYKNTKHNKQRRKLYTLGLLVVMGCIIYDLAFYIVNRYFGVQVIDIRGVSSLGILVFIVILILDLYQDITQKKMEEHERKLLIRRAYTDELTQINNRGYCAEYMQKLQYDPESEYTIFSLDLNELKKTNDTYGHYRGDVLIQSAASVIASAFSSIGVVGRMGGDEFIAILPINDEAQIEALEKKFKQRIEDANKENPELHLSISYGYATNKEVEENNIEKVYRLADDRMYEDKRLWKEQRQAL